MASQTTLRKLSTDSVDDLCQRREEIKAELAKIDEALKEQVEVHGFTPAGAEKSKRIETPAWKLTLSGGESTEIRDQGVETMKRVCPADLFVQLFSETTKYKLKSNASMVLAGTLPAGAPSNLRKLFAAAVVLKPKAPSLKVERVEAAD